MLAPLFLTHSPFFAPINSFPFLVITLIPFSPPLLFSIPNYILKRALAWRVEIFSARALLNKGLAFLAVTLFGPQRLIPISKNMLYRSLFFLKVASEFSNTVSPLSGSPLWNPSLTNLEMRYLCKSCGSACVACSWWTCAASRFCLLLRRESAQFTQTLWSWMNFFDFWSSPWRSGLLCGAMELGVCR